MYRNRHPLPQAPTIESAIWFPTLSARPNSQFMEMFLITALSKGVGFLSFIAYVFYVCRTFVPNLPMGGRVVLQFPQLSADGALE